MTRDRLGRDLDAALDRWIAKWHHRPCRCLSSRRRSPGRWSPGRRGCIRGTGNQPTAQAAGFPLIAVAATATLLVAALEFGVLGGGSGPTAISGTEPRHHQARLPYRVPTPSPFAGPTPAPGYATGPPDLPPPQPFVPPSPLPDPAGSPLPPELIGRLYNPNPRQMGDVQGSQLLVLTLRAAEDPHCLAMFEGRSTCFTILWTPNWPKHIQDPAVRGPARVVNGRLALEFALVPSDEECEGTTSTYEIEDGGDALRGVDVPVCSSFQGWTPH